jgi:hypothetical protein
LPTKIKFKMPFIVIPWNNIKIIPGIKYPLNSPQKVPIKVICSHGKKSNLGWRCFREFMVVSLFHSYFLNEKPFFKSVVKKTFSRINFKKTLILSLLVVGNSFIIK